MRKVAMLVGFLGIVFAVSSLAQAESPASNRVYIASTSVTEGDTGKTPFSVQVSYYGNNYNATIVTVAIE
jgi:hypothetical protein